MRTFNVLIASLLAFAATSAQADVVDAADRIASEYFRSVAHDGKEHLLVLCDNVVHDVSRFSTSDTVQKDLKKFSKAISECKTVVLFHNHPYGHNDNGDPYIPLPSWMDFGISIRFSYEIWKVSIKTTISHRVFQNRDGKPPLILEYAVAGKAIVSTLNNASMRNIYIDKLRTVPKESDEERKLVFLIVSLDYLQTGEIVDRTVLESENYIKKKCSDSVSVIEYWSICPNQGFFIKVRGVAP